MEFLWILYLQEREAGSNRTFCHFQNRSTDVLRNLLLLLLKSKDLCLHWVSNLYLRLSFMMPLAILVFKKCFFSYPDTVVGVDTIWHALLAILLAVQSDREGRGISPAAYWPTLVGQPLTPLAPVLQDTTQWESIGPSNWPSPCTHSVS